MKKGQGAFEYLLLIGGVLFLAVAVIMILRTGVLSTGQAALENATSQYQETIGCMVYCTVDSTNICSGKCGDVGGNSYYCDNGVLVNCSATGTSCTEGTGCA